MLKNYKFQVLILVVLTISGFLNSQTSLLGPNGQPLYFDGKIYLQIRMTSSVVIQNKDTILNDPGGSLLALFNKYQVIKTGIPFAVLNNPKLNRTYEISFNQVTKVDSFLIELNQITSAIEYVEKVPAVYSFLIPNDPMATSSPTVLYHLPLLNANQASNTYTTNGNAIVAIVDDAVLTSHEDLAANIGTINIDLADNDNNVEPPFGNESQFKHGTFVAGIAGGVTNNGKGIASIGWNNKLMCIKTAMNVSSFPVTLSHAYQGVSYAAANGAQVINMSWGTYAPSNTEYQVIVAAKNNNVVLVAAAGNAGVNLPGYPAAYGEGVSGLSGELFDKNLVVAVAALDRNSNVSLWPNSEGSNFGNWVDISAYGTDIWSTDAVSSTSSVIVNSYNKYNGTSAAAPMIAGIAGVMRSYDMTKTADQIIDCLLYTANPDIYGSNHPSNIPGTLGKGRADADAALRCLSSTCSVSPITIIVPSSPSLCASTSITLTANQGAISYAWSNGSSTQSTVINSAGVYSVMATYSNHCTSSASISIASPPTLSLSSTTNTSFCPGSTINLLTATGTFSSLLWSPGGMTTNSVVVNPVAYTVYTVFANPFCGGSTQTIGVNPTGGSQSLTAFSVIGSTLAGNYAGIPFGNFGRFILTSDAVVAGSSRFARAEVILSPNVKITIPQNSVLDLYLGHLHTCGTDMWKGIEVNDGGKFNSERSSLIQDAITAISSTHTPISSSGIPAATVTLIYTAFNRNLVDVSLTNFYDFNVTTNTYTNNLSIDNCAFTCRNFTAWLSAGDPGNLGIRFLSTPSSSLHTPHSLGNLSLANLKAPYSNQKSHIAIQLNSVGITTNNAFYSVQIGDDSDPNNFNLFDTHHKFIEATNSNVILRNNVFQNSTGPAVESVFSSTLGMKGLLDLAAISSSVTNKFWDCKQAVSGNRVYKFNMLRAVVRSTQNSTNTANSALRFGVTLKSGRFDYLISQNEFTNIYDAINISVIPVPINSGTFTSSFIDAEDLIITANTINSGSVSGSFSNRAINVSSLFNIPWTNASACNYTYSSTYGGAVSNHCRGLTIDGNNINGAFRGIAVNGVSNFQTNIQDNTITLNDDNVFNVAQQGIYLVNSISGASKARQFQITQNSISGGSSSTSNPLMSMVFSGNNMGIYSPSISCNELQNSYKGFVFNGANSSAVWAGNVMQPLTQGLRLENAAVIGTQGGPSLVNANQWQGTWTGDHTYVDGAATNATNSVLWVKNFTNLFPANNSGPASSQNYGTGNNSVRDGSLAADFNCIGIPNGLVIPLPNSNDFNNDTQSEYYIQQTALYRFLHFNDSLRLADVGGDLDTYYSSMTGSSIDKFMQVEELLYAGDYNGARDVLDPIEPAENHPVETNYKNFYTLCANYLEANESLSEADSTALYELAELCPGTNGACIYQARALYNALYGFERNYVACMDESGNRAANNVSQEQLILKEENNQSTIKLFPNPATNKLIIFGGKANECVTIDIKDVSGRTVLQKLIQVKSIGYELDLNLINGIYFVKLTDSENKVLNEKLIIAK